MIDPIGIAVCVSPVLITGIVVFLIEKTMYNPRKNFFKAMQVEEDNMKKCSDLILFLRKTNCITSTAAWDAMNSIVHKNSVRLINYARIINMI